MNNNNAEPNIIAETVIIAFKVFLVIYLATIAVIAVLYYKPTSPRAGNAKVEITQLGNKNISQKINN